MSDDSEERDGPGVAAGVGAVVGGGGAALAVDRDLTNRGIRQVLDGSGDAPAHIAEGVEKTLEDSKNFALKQQHAELGATKTFLEKQAAELKTVAIQPKIEGIKYIRHGNGYILHPLDAAGNRIPLSTAPVQVSTLPHNVRPGKLYTDPTLISNATKGQKFNFTQAQQSAETIIQDITFKGKAGEYVMHITDGTGATSTLSGIKTLPANVKVDQAITDTKVIGELTKDMNAKSILQSRETLYSGVRKGSSFEIGSGFKTLENGGLKSLSNATKLKYVGAAVAGVGVGAYAIHQIFGGKHTNRLRAENAVQSDLGRA